MSNSLRRALTMSKSLVKPKGTQHLYPMYGPLYLISYAYLKELSSSQEHPLGSSAMANGRSITPDPLDSFLPGDNQLITPAEMCNNLKPTTSTKEDETDEQQRASDRPSRSARVVEKAILTEHYDQYGSTCMTMPSLTSRAIGTDPSKVSTGEVKRLPVCELGRLRDENLQGQDNHVSSQKLESDALHLLQIQKEKEELQTQLQKTQADLREAKEYINKLSKLVADTKSQDRRYASSSMTSCDTSPAVTALNGKHASHGFENSQTRQHFSVREVPTRNQSTNLIATHQPSILLNASGSQKATGRRYKSSIDGASTSNATFSATPIHTNENERRELPDDQASLTTLSVASMLSAPKKRKRGRPRSELKNISESETSPDEFCDLSLTKQDTTSMTMHGRHGDDDSQLSFGERLRKRDQSHKKGRK